MISLTIDYSFSHPTSYRRVHVCFRHAVELAPSYNIETDVVDGENYIRCDVCNGPARLERREKEEGV